MQFSQSRKKGMRAVIPGFINYGCRDGETAGHTKSAYTNYKILTNHGIITLNTLMYINKIKNNSSALPLYDIVNTISKESPVQGATHKT